MTFTSVQRRPTLCREHGEQEAYSCFCHAFCYARIVRNRIFLAPIPYDTLWYYRIEPKLEERIKRTLTDGLGWLCKKRQEGARYITRLEAR